MVCGEKRLTDASADCGKCSADSGNTKERKVDIRSLSKNFFYRSNKLSPQSLTCAHVVASHITVHIVDREYIKRVREELLARK